MLPHKNDSTMFNLEVGGLGLDRCPSAFIFVFEIVVKYNFKIFLKNIWYSEILFQNLKLVFNIIEK
jgi:hypothetical protein